MKKNLYTGIALIALGALFLLYNLNMFDLAWMLFIASLVLLTRYTLNKDTLFLLIGLSLLAFSSVALIDRYIFININISLFVYLSVAGIGLLYLYYKNHEKNWLILANILLALAFSNVLIQLYPVFSYWGKYFLLALSFYISYLVAYRSNSIVWPKHISYIMLVVGCLQLFLRRDLLKIVDLRLAYLLPVVRILIGVKILYSTISNR